MSREGSRRGAQRWAKVVRMPRDPRRRRWKISQRSKGIGKLQLRIIATTARRDRRRGASTLATSHHHGPGGRAWDRALSNIRC
ncbi:unnamed protein product [Merluccius merluccius]